MKKIIVFGLGYVGLSNAIMLASNNQVTAIDIDKNKVNLLKRSKSPIKEDLIDDYLKNKNLNLKVVDNHNSCDIEKADIILIATPTDYNTETNSFDTKSVDSIVSEISSLNKSATIVIKSTIPVGHTQNLIEKNQNENIIFCPEFLREGKSLEDSLNPSRIIIGGNKEKSKIFSEVLLKSVNSDNCPLIFMGSSEAESVKLFSNTYLAMRVAFFNELDTYAEIKGFDTKSIIEGVCMDPRIGDFYNNPSFGYGGYCLPKDTKQVLSDYNGIPNDLFKAIVKANETRIKHISDSIISRNPKTVGVYRLAMKMDSDNARQSSVLAVIENLRKSGIEVLVYEPNMNINQKDSSFKLTSSLEDLKNKSDLIIANRITEDLKDIKNMLYTRDVFSRD